MAAVLAAAAAAPPMDAGGIPEPAPASERVDCARCGGAGYVRVERPVDHPEFGRAIECGCEASRRAAAERARMRGLSNLGPLYGCRIAAGEGERLPGFAEACAFADEESTERWLVMTGESDDARMRLLAEMANRRLDAGLDALYFVAPDLLDRLRGAYSRDDGVAYAALFEYLREASFLIVDDLDRTNPTAWAREKIWQLLSDRRKRGARTVLALRSASRDPLELGRLLDRGDGVLGIAAGNGRRDQAAAAYREVGGMRLEMLRRFTFDGFRIDTAADTNLRLVRSVVEAWAEDPNGWLTLLGATGTGKTHLAAAAAGQRLDAGDSVYFAVVPDLFDALRETYGAESPRQLRRALRRPPRGRRARARRPARPSPLRLGRREALPAAGPPLPPVPADSDHLEPRPRRTGRAQPQNRLPLGRSSSRRGLRNQRPRSPHRPAPTCPLDPTPLIHLLATARTQ